MEKIHGEIIQKVLDYARAHLGDAPTVADLAKRSGYSPSRLRHIFRQATGRGLLSHLLDLRIDKAKRLLIDTRIPVSDIAFEAGFRSHNRFSQLFRKKIGCSPRAFRLSGRDSSASDNHVRFPDNEQKYFVSFMGKEWNRDFVVRSGNWVQDKEYLSGKADENAMIFLSRPLPENFRLLVEVQPIPYAGLPNSEFEIRIQNQNGNQDYCDFVLGKFGGTTGELRPRGFGSQLNSSAVLAKDQWNRVQLELKDDTIQVMANGKDLFTHRDPFPPPLSKRSHIALLTYKGHIQIRNFEIVDLGFLPLVRSVRQGDSLYNAGLYSAARDFYMKLLQSQSSMADTMELRYKIGQCFRADENLLQARAWMEKVVDLPEEGFWAEQARLGLFELDIREGRFVRLRQTIAGLFEKESLRHGVREIVDLSCAWLIRHGFYDKACALREFLFQAEENGSHLYFAAETKLAEVLFHLHQYRESEIHFRSVTSQSALPPVFRAPMLFNLGDALAFQCKFAEWWELLKQVEPIVAHHSFNLCRLHMHRAFFFRIQGEYDRAISELSIVQAMLPAHDPLSDLAKIHSARILCCEGKAAEARVLVEQLRDSHAFGDYRISLFGILEFMEGNFEKAAQIFLEASRMQQDSHVGAEWGIKAGILFSLAGNIKEAERIWKRTSEYYVPERYNFIGSLAENLLAGSTANAERLPYPPVNRSEMFFFLGLFCQSRAEISRARELFQLCLDEDKALDLPAVLARKKLVHL